MLKNCLKQFVRFHLGLRSQTFDYFFFQAMVSNKSRTLDVFSRISVTLLLQIFPEAWPSLLNFKVKLLLFRWGFMLWEIFLSVVVKFLKNCKKTDGIWFHLNSFLTSKAVQLQFWLSLQGQFLNVSCNLARSY